VDTSALSYALEQCEVGFELYHTTLSNGGFCGCFGIMTTSFFGTPAFFFDTVAFFFGTTAMLFDTECEEVSRG
jgi:hypothetical protein